MPWVFAYGSNMHLFDLGQWMSTRNVPLGRILQASAAKLIGYRLVWNYYSPARAGGAANIEPAAGDLPGVALRVNRQGLDALDRKEGFPIRYGRHRARAVLASGRAVDVWTYIAEPAYRRQQLVPPTRHYRRLLIEGALHFKLPMAHVRALEAVATCD